MPLRADTEVHDHGSKLFSADPSSLTTQQLWREIAMLKELLTQRITSVETAIEVAHQDMVRVPTDVQKQVGNLKELHDSKFQALTELRARYIIEVEGRLSKIESQQIEVATVDRNTALVVASLRTEVAAFKDHVAATNLEQKAAIASALMAAKEAVGEQNKSAAQAITKSETATNKQIEQLGQLLNTTTNSSDGKINDLKDRMTRIEGRGEGKVETKAEGQTGLTNVFMVLGFVIGAAGFLFGIISWVKP